MGGKTTFYQTAVMYSVATCSCREVVLGRYSHSLDMHVNMEESKRVSAAFAFRYMNNHVYRNTFQI